MGEVVSIEAPRGPVTGFELRLQGLEIAAGVCRLEGLESSSRMTESAETDLRGVPYVRRTPGPETWADIVLGRPLDGSLVLWRWREAVLRDGADAARVDGHIALLDAAGREVALFRFEQGWPGRYRVVGLSDPFGPVLEEIQICHDGLRRIR